MNELNSIVKKANARYQLWELFIDNFSCRGVCEIGVYKGDFAEHILKKCPHLNSYTMIDPWRNLSDWNKPANKTDDEFEKFYEETLLKTEFAKEKRHILRGTTSETVHSILDNSLDFVYIDGDHTLKGITIDLLSIWTKVKPNGFIAGDDFCPSIWQHSDNYEPTLVFPFALYFAEAMNIKIYALPFNQFLIFKGQTGFEFIDFTHGKYQNKDLKTLMIKPKKKNGSSIIQNLKAKINRFSLSL